MLSVCIICHSFTGILHVYLFYWDLYFSWIIAESSELVHEYTYIMYLIDNNELLQRIKKTHYLLMVRPMGAKPQFSPLSAKICLHLNEYTYSMFPEMYSLHNKWVKYV